MQVETLHCVEKKDPVPINSATRSVIDFTLHGYRNLINELLNSGYAFRSFPEARRALNQKERFVLMRHDIDFDLEAAEQMSALEEETGVQATYFFMLRTEHYNLLTPRASESV